MKTFEELIKEISPTLKHIVYRVGRRAVLSGYDDLYQEAMLRLWLDFKEGKLRDKTNSYILQGSYFHLKNYLRKRFHKQETESLSAFTNAQGEGFDLGDILPSCRVDGPEEEVHCNMLIEAIRNNGLTDREKDVFLLCLEGLTTREMGKRLGISHVRVIVLQKSMREKCRRHLEC